MSPATPAPATRAPRAHRDLHPVAWWGWALGLAGAASLTTNPVLLLGLVAAAGLVVAARRGDHPWSRAFRLYLALGALIVLIRVGFRILLGGGAYPGATVWFRLPEVPLPDWVAGVTLLGDVTAESVLGAAYDGLRLATLVICVGAANALANPKRLLRSMPAALHEVGTALVVAISVLPQLASSVTRVRRAQQLRGAPPGRGTALRRTVVPVLEDALDRSLLLAAGMDSRGYGRDGDPAVAGRRRRSTVWLVGSLALLAVAVYAFLDTTAPGWLAWSTTAAGVAVGARGVQESGRTVRRTRYRADPWRHGETLVVAAGLLVLVAVAVSVRTHELVVRPDVTAAPTLTVLLLGVLLVAASPALLAPPPALALGPVRAVPDEQVPPGQDAGGRDDAGIRPGRRAVAG